jgi:hypothetical protein
MRFIVLTFSIAIAVLGAIGIFVPTVLLAVSRPFLSPPFSMSPPAFASSSARRSSSLPTSRAPKTLRILGVVIFVGGLATPPIGVERARVIVARLTTHGPALMRVWAGFALGLGLLLAYAVAPRRPWSDRL